MRLSRSLLPNIRDDERNRPTPRDEARHADLVSRAQSLARSGTPDARTISAARELDREWKSAGKASPANYHAFRSAMDEIFAANKQRIDQMKADWAANKSAKERLVSQAESLASSSDLRAASDRMKSLGDEWKRIGPCEKSDNERLWGRFNAARTRLRERKDQEFNKRKAEWAANKSAKERLVSQAESLASSSDLRAASDRMKSLGDEWKRIGPCEKSDNERLWGRFNAARTRLRERKDQEFNKRKAEWAANRSAKERLVGRMSSLSSSSDYRAAKDEARSLTDQWRAVGPCEKSDQERLWNDFKSAKDRLFEAAKRDGEQRAAERRQRAWERVSRLEEQLRNTEAALYRAQDSYSRALSARSPSMNNPNWMTIVRNQQERQSNARSKIASLEQRKSDLVYKLMDARSKANSL
ncbi:MULTISPECIES: DUF349 domain-containing protein [unclassified Arthrobacter]|uniref:DUF349 domain-containing protein n=1 Tax=unclassified Arthrobacter TaxID=235627 RepID=UPI0021A7A221|nr:DUF349 domain-containing protein [Arthrobacter sp. MAHUQ-56]